MEQAQHGFKMIVANLICPPRIEYDPATSLGPLNFTYCGRSFQRTDFQLTNPRNHVLEVSWWEPVAAERPAAKLPCIVYLHDYLSCRLDSLENLGLALSLGCSYLSIDCSGCGRSGGRCVSFGFYEKDDLAAVLAHLKQAGSVSAVAVWGVCVGAAAVASIPCTYKYML
jgi:hypothetical protein